MRPIDADALKEQAYESREWSHGGHPFVVEVDDIDDAPTIDPDDLRPKGEWIVVDGFTCCNYCGCSPADWEADSKNESGLPPYCHSCGRKMKGGGE